MSFMIKHHTYRPDIILSNDTLFLLIVGLASITLIYDQKRNVTRFIVWSFFYFYIYWLLKMTIFPIAIFINSHILFSNIGYGNIEFFEQHPFKLIKYIFKSEAAMYNIFGNIIMLAPLTAILGLLYKKFSYWWMMLLISLLTSITIEGTQLLLTYFYMSSRNFDIMDIITNSTGGLIIGYGSYHLFKWICPKVVKNAQI